MLGGFYVDGRALTGWIQTGDANAQQNPVAGVNVVVSFYNRCVKTFNPKRTIFFIPKQTKYPNLIMKNVCFYV